MSGTTYGMANDTGLVYMIASEVTRAGRTMVLGKLILPATMRNAESTASDGIRKTQAVDPDQLLSYYFWAEDMGPDGKIRQHGRRHVLC